MLRCESFCWTTQRSPLQDPSIFSACQPNLERPKKRDTQLRVLMPYESVVLGLRDKIKTFLLNNKVTFQLYGGDANRIESCDRCWLVLKSFLGPGS